MKLTIIIIVLFISSIAIAQTKVDSTEVKNIEMELTQIKPMIIQTQSEIYERQEKLKQLYTRYSYLIDILQPKKELIEEKKKSKVK